MNEAFHIYVHIYSRICTMTHLQMWYVYVTWLISRRDMWLSWKSSFIHVDVTRFHAQQGDWRMRWSVSSYSRSHGVGWEPRHRNLHTATLQHTATHCNTLLQCAMVEIRGIATYRTLKRTVCVHMCDAGCQFTVTNSEPQTTLCAFIFTAHSEPQPNRNLNRGIATYRTVNMNVHIHCA